MTVQDIISAAKQFRASDVHFEEGTPPYLRVDGEIRKLTEEYVLDSYKEQLTDLLTKEQQALFAGGTDVDFALQTKDGIRCRVNLFHKMEKMGCVMRLLADSIPTTEELGLPPILQQLAMRKRGLVLVTGPTGSGKSTTLAAMVGHANKNRNGHIITVEDPIEYVHEPCNCIVSQREVGRDVESFAVALRSAMREDPDIILLGEMRDFETISAALTAAETGHLVFSTIHTTGAAKSIDRIIDVFPPYQQEQIRTQLAGVLQAVITQQLVKCVDGGRVAALEIMLAVPSVANMIREGKTHQIDSAMQTGGKSGMVLMDNSLGQLVRQGRVEYKEAQDCCVKENDLNMFARRI